MSPGPIDPSVAFTPTLLNLCTVPGSVDPPPFLKLSLSSDAMMLHSTGRL